MTVRDRLSVSHVIAPAPFGGLESVVTSLALGFARRGHEVRVVALLNPHEQSHALQRLPAGGVEVVEIRLPPRSYRGEVGRLATELSRASGTIVHSHGYHADLVGFFAARRARAPTVSTVHGFVGGELRNRVYEWCDIRALTRFGGVVAVSRPLADRLVSSGVSSSRLHLIPNAHESARPPLDRTEARQLLGLPRNGWIAGWVGRLSHEKGPDVFLEALARAPEWEASLLGSGPQESSLRSQADALGIATRLKWHGMVPDAGSLLRAFDAVVLSSRTEGTPVVLLEAMAAGVPVVATAVGGVPDVVSDRDALLVPPEQPALLARALQAIRADSEATITRVAAARARLESAYALEPWLDRYEAVYRLVGAPPPTETGTR
jgi:glycosyltransferase involved in cell wall biosynthesis